jgi:hypothetical protein
MDVSLEIATTPTAARYVDRARMVGIRVAEGSSALNIQPMAFVIVGAIVGVAIGVSFVMRNILLEIRESVDCTLIGRLITCRRGIIVSSGMRSADVVFLSVGRSTIV